jgi:N-acetylmuramoyl-L-alanine amidase
MTFGDITSAISTVARLGVCVVMAGLALPAAAETALSPFPADDERVVAEATQPSAGLPALIKMVAAETHATQAEADRELDCLATAVWFESRGEAPEGQLAVAQAVVNRAKSGRWGKGMCGVIRAPRQFNFVPERVQRSTSTFTTSLAVARIAMLGLWHDIAEGAHSFHAARLKPGWRLTRVAKVGNHVFYR